MSLYNKFETKKLYSGTQLCHSVTTALTETAASGWCSGYHLAQISSRSQHTATHKGRQQNCRCTTSSELEKSDFNHVTNVTTVLSETTASLADRLFLVHGYCCASKNIVIVFFGSRLQGAQPGIRINPSCRSTST